MSDETEVVLHINRLVIEGYPGHLGWRIASSVESELGRLLTERGLPPAMRNGGAVPVVEADAFRPRPTDRAEAIGAQLAHAIYDAMSTTSPEGPGW